MQLLKLNLNTLFKNTGTKRFFFQGFHWRTTFVSWKYLLKELSLKIHFGNCNFSIFYVYRSSKWVILSTQIVSNRKPLVVPLFLIVCAMCRSSFTSLFIQVLFISVFFFVQILAVIKMVGLQSWLNLTDMLILLQEKDKKRRFTV